MRESLVRHLQHNLGTKLISITLAAGLWLAAARDPITEIMVNVPIEFQGIPQDLQISSENSLRTKITLRGPERAIRRLQDSDVYAQLGFSGVESGVKDFDLTPHQVQHPPGIEVVQITPSHIHLTLEPRAER